MRYIPPRQWPPTRHDRPPADDWVPPEFWEPKDCSFPISPDGVFKLVSSPNASVPAPSDQEIDQLQRDVAERMLGIWARATLKDLHSYYQAAMRAAWTDRAIDYGEDWSPDQRDLTVALEEVWVRGYRLITANHQMERWLQAHRRLNGQAEETAEYAKLRNALEHLDEAKFDAATARRSPEGRKFQSIDDLPGKELFMGFHSSFTRNVFGIADLRTIFEKASLYREFGTDDDLHYEPSPEDLQWLREDADHGSDE